MFATADEVRPAGELTASQVDLCFRIYWRLLEARCDEGILCNQVIEEFFQASEYSIEVDDQPAKKGKSKSTICEG